MNMVAGAVISGAAALWKIVTDYLNRASDAKRAKVLSLIAYVDAARLSVLALAVEGQEIVAQALVITPDSDDVAVNELKERTISYLITDDNRARLEPALAGIKEHLKYLNDQNETKSDWPLGDAASRGEILIAVRELLKKLEDFLEKLAWGGPLIPDTGLLFIEDMQKPIKAGDRVGIRESALAALQHPSYSAWRGLVVECEKIVSDLKLKFQ
jgi:hypothetical protein